jgi:hypothetical protein
MFYLLVGHVLFTSEWVRILCIGSQSVDDSVFYVLSVGPDTDLMYCVRVFFWVHILLTVYWSNPNSNNTAPSVGTITTGLFGLV